MNLLEQNFTEESTKKSRFQYTIERQFYFMFVRSDSFISFKCPIIQLTHPTTMYHSTGIYSKKIVTKRIPQNKEISKIRDLLFTIKNWYYITVEFIKLRNDLVQIYCVVFYSLALLWFINIYGFPPPCPFPTICHCWIISDFKSDSKQFTAQQSMLHSMILFQSLHYTILLSSFLHILIFLKRLHLSCLEL